MLKRDSITAQMQQLSHTLAKVKRLIVEEQLAEAVPALEAVLGDYFGTSITDLLETPVNVFSDKLKKAGFLPAELSLLADFLDTAAETRERRADRNLIWEKVLFIYDVLERDHKVVSFAHIARRAAINASEGG